MNARIQQPHTAFPQQQRGAMLVLVVIAVRALRRRRQGES